MAGVLHLAYEGPDGRIVVTDSLTYCDERIRPVDVVVGGSFVGTYPTALVLRRGGRGVIGSDAGRGLADAGVGGLALAERWGVPCAAVAAASARLADGPDTYQSGVISVVNRAGAELGVRVGMSCTEAAQLLLAAPPGQPGRAADQADAAPEVVWEGPLGRVIAAPSASLARAEHAGAVICAGSHTATVTARYVLAYGFPIAGVICSDGGVGKESSGIGGLEPLAAAGIAAAAVSHRTARIGDGRSTYEDGIVAHLNAPAEAAGVRVGQPAREAALAMLRAQAPQRGAESG